MPRTLPTCPDLCQNPHLEQPGDLIHHYWPAAHFPQTDDGRPLPVYIGYYEHDMRMRLEIGGFSLNLNTAAALLGDLQLKLPRMEQLQTSLDTDALLDGLLDRYQVTS